MRGKRHPFSPRSLDGGDPNGAHGHRGHVADGHTDGPAHYELLRALHESADDNILGVRPGDGQPNVHNIAGEDMPVE